MMEEFRLHLEHVTQQYADRGMSPTEARQAALRRFGHVEGFKEEIRGQRGLPWLEEIAADLKFSARLLRKNPGFTFLTVLTLGIGIGATTAIFSIVNNVVLQPLPYPQSDRIVVLAETLPAKTTPFGVSARSFAEWRRQSATLQAIALHRNLQFVLTGSGEPARRFSLQVTPDYFSVMGVQPILGRTFVPEDGVAGQHQVIVLNYKFWMSQFDGDPGVIGRKVLLSDVPYTIIGVAPQSFLPEPMTDPSVFMPLLISPADAENFSARSYGAVARLKPGVTLEQASSEMDVIAQRIAARYPDTNRGVGIRVVSLLETKVGSVRPLLLTLLGAVGFLLLIACVNVANLLLARAGSRQREIAVRAALGATRSRIIRQQLCESLLIAFLGSALGVVLAYVSKDFLLSFGPLTLPRSQEIAVDGTALLFTCTLGTLTGLGFGLGPALQATRANFPEVMKDGGRGRVMGLRNALVVGEVALALTLLVNAGLLIRSFERLRQVDLGFDAGVGVTHQAGLLLTPKNYPTPEKLVAFARAATARLREVPGVRQTALSSSLPNFGWLKRIVLGEGRPDLLPAHLPPSSFYITTPGYFEILHLRLLGGRLYDEHDRLGTTPVAVVSEGFARKYFPGQNPLGKHLQPLGTTAWHEIIGVVNDVREDGPFRPSSSLQVYEPYAQNPTRSVRFVVRIDRPAPGLRAGLRAALDSIDPDLPLFDLKEGLDVFIQDSIAPQRFALFLVTVFSAVALLLSALGIYGVVAYSVTKRTQEIGIRRALGAQPGDILRLVFSQTGRMVLLGLAGGLAGAWASTRLLHSLSLLFEIGPQDPLTFASTPLLLALVAVLACWLPARRAARVDPLVALRHE